MLCLWLHPSWAQRLGLVSWCLAAGLSCGLCWWSGLVLLGSSHALKISFVSPLPISCLSLTQPYPISQWKLIQINRSALIACQSSEGDLLDVGLSDSRVVISSKHVTCTSMVSELTDVVKHQSVFSWNWVSQSTVEVKVQSERNNYEDIHKATGNYNLTQINPLSGMRYLAHEHCKCA